MRSRHKARDTIDNNSIYSQRHRLFIMRLRESRKERARSSNRRRTIAPFFSVCRMRLGVRGHGLPRRMRPSQSRIPRAVSTEHPLPLLDHLWPANLHRHQLHGGASSLQVSARPWNNDHELSSVRRNVPSPWTIRR